MSVTQVSRRSIWSYWWISQFRLAMHQDLSRILGESVTFGEAVNRFIAIGTGELVAVAEDFSLERERGCGGRSRSGACAKHRSSCAAVII